MKQLATQIEKTTLQNVFISFLQRIFNMIIIKDYKLDDKSWSPPHPSRQEFRHDLQIRAARFSPCFQLMTELTMKKVDTNYHPDNQEKRTEWWDTMTATLTREQ